MTSPGPGRTPVACRRLPRAIAENNAGLTSYWFDQFNQLFALRQQVQAIYEAQRKIYEDAANAVGRPIPVDISTFDPDEIDRLPVLPVFVGGPYV